MNSGDTTQKIAGLSLRQAALVAGIAYLLFPVAFAEFYVFPKLLVHEDIELTVQNITAHPQLFFIGILCHFITLFLDVVIAWALYVLLAPVNRALSLLTAWLRLAYAVIAFSGLMNMVTVLRLLTTPYYQTLFGDQQLHAQVQLLLNEFRYDFSMALVIFGLHLVLLGYLIIRSGYIPAILGGILALLGAGWVIYCLRPYLYPSAPLDFIPLLGFGELLFPLWLVIRGWKIKEPAGQG